MARNPTSKSNDNPPFSSSSRFLSGSFSIIDDDDFQDGPSPSVSSALRTSSLPSRLTPHNSTTVRPSKKLKKQKPVHPGKENRVFNEIHADLDCGLDSIEPTLDLLNPKGGDDYSHSDNLVGSELLKPSGEDGEKDFDEEFFEGSTQLDELLKLCADVGEPDIDNSRDDSEGKCEVLICCPVCGADISGLSDDLRQTHTNECLDKVEGPTEVAVAEDGTEAHQCPGQVVDGSPFKSSKKVVDMSPVIEWLRNLGLAKYEELFVSQEINWDTLQWLTEEDLCSIGITTLGPRKKILHALRELKNDSRMVEPKTHVSKGVADETKLGTNKLITEYFSLNLSERKRSSTTPNGQKNGGRSQAKANTTRRSTERKDSGRSGKQKDVPLWCCIPGTPFRVDAFKYLRRDCSHWFLTHFHLDHYQGLTRSFCHGMIYCSLITAKLVNLKIGIPWDKIQVLPVNQKINIAGIDVTCFDANHCPGAIIILFEPPNGEPVLHTGDFRFCEEMTELSILRACRIHTLILDTTYCNPQYDFPKQDTIIQFVIDAIQAEAFNPKTLFLIGSYTIGKERLFIEVARALRKKVYVTAAKLRLLECLGLQEEDMQWFTLNEQESHIHVVPMWTVASFKRLKQMSNQYMGRFSLIVAFSPTGWSFGKGKKSTGRRWQQGTIIRYEVPYSEHSSFTELKEFVKFISPVDIIPSVNNNGPDSHNSMVSQLLA
ncbi:putative hydrolase involved in interstrand cross-link repair [Handroanthus impetiginosus]|uniref:Putative hydrolase involved in interstrand cross-link repair n=1 Tax=Handroanthus impetiginosus TaxID=429701 RepID=A0A2G9H4T1_9LAMI|nr:putative hydrolase involved in interstrand cross-link repair [Handroanthus impetiginosus]